MPAPPALFDRLLVRRRRDRAAARFSQHAFLFDRNIADFADRLSAIRQPFARALTLNDSGRARRMLEELWPGADEVERWVAADLSARMLAAAPPPSIQCDLEHLPFAPASFDLVLAPLAFHSANDLLGALIQIRQILRPGGLFLGSLFAAGSLKPLRDALIEAESAVTGGAGLRVAPMADPQDLPALLQRAGFRSPVVDEDRVSVRYRGLASLLGDLRGMGEAASMHTRARRPLLGRCLAAAEARLRGPGGEERFAIPFLIANLTGWAVEPI